MKNIRNTRSTSSNVSINNENIVNEQNINMEYETNSNNINLSENNEENNIIDDNTNNSNTIDDATNNSNINMNNNCTTIPSIKSIYNSIILGNEPEIQLHLYPETKVLQEKFNSLIYNHSVHCCSFCHELWYDIKGDIFNNAF